MKSNSFKCTQLQIGRDGMACADAIDLELLAGALLVVQGANGAGKSTLLKTLAGLLPAIAGSYVHDCDAPALLYIGHRHGMLGEVSVAENVAFWARSYGVPELAATALHYFDLGPYVDMPLCELSAGWQQRVSLTRLITIPANLWLLDEPAANLDRDGANLLQSLLQTRLEQGGIALLTSHASWGGEKVQTLTLTNENQFIEEISS
ncbi:MAG: heme ABC exporter ATP-binding protein CcmA [Rickettsiales bacterium]